VADEVLVARKKKLWAEPKPKRRHEELALLVEAGLTPRQALWSATVGPAEFAGLTESLGRIAAGQMADILLLGANPLSDIRNTRRIDVIVQAGRIFTRPALDSILADVRAINSRK
jgi:imidazolonepropionase-like amidohydrolase